MGKIDQALFETMFPGRASQMIVDRSEIKTLYRTVELSHERQVALVLELESLKKKIVERAQTPTMIKAKSAAEIRRMVEQNNEREFEEQANGI